MDALLIGGTSPARFPSCVSPKTIVKAKGSLVWVDEDNVPYTDLLSGVFTTNLGHNHEAVSDAVKDQADKLAFCCHVEGQVAEITLSYACELVTKTKGMSGLFLTCSGSDAVEASIFAAKQCATEKGELQRDRIVCFERSYHGATYLARQLSRVGGWHQMYWPGFRGARDVIKRPRTPDENDTVIQSFSELVASRGNQLLAIIIEVISVTDGATYLDSYFCTAICQIAKKAGIAVIFDELITGFGRTGRLWASDRYNPDYIVFGKAATSGYGALSGVLMTAENFSLLKHAGFPHGHTYCGHPVSCAAALATLRALSPDLISQSYLNGEYFRSEIALALKNVPVRGYGMLLSIDLNSDLFCSSETASAHVARLQQGFWEQHIFARAGPKTILAPPLTMSREELSIAASKIAKAIHSVLDV